jgi:AcrR family transcriptional regulator
MARTLKEEQYAARRKDILNVAFELIYSKGYEQMSIQDILDTLHISKGAFYHYFGSKAALLESVADNLVDEITPQLEEIVHNSQQSAIDKLQCYIDTAVRWKTERKVFMVALLHVWYADENAVVRLKIMNRSVERISPLLTEIFLQGVSEGVFTTRYAEDICQVIINLLGGLGDAFARLLLASQPSPDDLKRLQSTVDAYTDALERILGCPLGSLVLIDRATVKEWFDILQTAQEALPEQSIEVLAS